jgi:hypothetical protein
MNMPKRASLNQEAFSEVCANSLAEILNSNNDKISSRLIDGIIKVVLFF